MEKSQCYIGTPNGVILCVDCIRGQQLHARFYHAYQQEPVVVYTIEDLLFELEAFYDSINFPHPTTNDRIFQGALRQGKNRKERKKIMSDKELLSKHGDLGTFIIRVQHRQNSSWQGRITWMDKDKTVYFRSIWEMIKLVGSALDTVSVPEDGELELGWPED